MWPKLKWAATCTAEVIKVTITGESYTRDSAIIYSKRGDREEVNVKGAGEMPWILMEKKEENLGRQPHRRVRARNTQRSERSKTRGQTKSEH